MTDQRRTRHCLGCSYNLRGLVEDRCPECGRPFDPNDPASFRIGPPPGKAYLAAAIVSALAACTGLVLTRLADWGVIAPPDPKLSSSALKTAAVILLILGLGVAASILVGAAHVLMRYPGDARSKSVFFAAFLVSLVGMIACLAAFTLACRPAWRLGGARATDSAPLRSVLPGGRNARLGIPESTATGARPLREGTERLNPARLG